MKHRQTRRGSLLAALAGLCLHPAISHAAVLTVGTGNDTSFLVLESPNLGSRTYEIRYTYDSGLPQTAKFLIDQVLAAESTLTVAFLNFGTAESPNFFVDSVSLAGIPESGSFAPPWTFWAHWVAGGLGFMDSGFNFQPGAPPHNTWVSGFGISTHTIAPGSWDALVLSDGNSPPAVAIPEPASVLLVSLASGLLWIRRRA
jgi:hypothetical protein